ncbi:MAG: type II secretion system F family protein [Verrucomicrobiota bacterium]|nr:type II secretion system F family protein [Verrucomicrobiota bacterium]
MSTFEYCGFDPRGRASSGVIEAGSLKEARERLAAGGVLARRVNPSRRRLRFSTDVRAVVYRELSALLRAGFPMVQAMDTLIHSHPLSQARILLGSLREAVAHGRSLDEAMSQACPALPALERAMIAAAERSATMETMLERLSAFLEEQEKLRASIHTAFIYPACVVGLGALSAIVMLGVFVPMLTRALSVAETDLPALTQLIMRVGRFATHWVVLVALTALAGSVALAWRRARRDKAARERWDARLFRVPGLGRGYVLLAGLRFAETLATLLKSGVSAIEGLPLAAQATGSPWLTRLAAIEVESIRHGEKLSDAVERMPPLAAPLSPWIRTGEAGGNLAALLEHAASRCQSQFDRYVARLLAVVPLLLILLVGGFVLLIALAVLLPVFSLTEGLHPV